MMPYAGNGRIAQDQFAGAIEITDTQYTEALEGMCSGLEVSIEGGFKVAPPQIPEVPPAPVPTPEELETIALSRRDSLLALAAVRIAPLADAVDLGSATADEVAALRLWKQYRVELNRIEQQVGYPTTVDWPSSPDESAMS
ncbi:hypothetical protein GIB64_24565 [Pseudomonas lactis]|uniref:tail fiber assembly protein n=1 Tax=Pseudomonas TaxID=286 RepID=UPI000D047ACC|nr:MULTISPECIES: tail fiber assembly protein [Pseudomonas]MBA5960609.1 hypothetical protein [Pseudomonas lactis]PRW73733.1 phage tail protein [Pseudomonas fluorescens]PRW75146.1 phage tail protein [Pseudomonas fluorescens]